MNLSPVPVLLILLVAAGGSVGCTPNQASAGAAAARPDRGPVASRLDAAPQRAPDETAEPRRRPRTLVRDTRKADGLTRSAAAGAPRSTQPSAPSANWSQFRGPDGQGVSPDKVLPIQWNATQGIAWKTALPGPGTSSPVIWGDRIYLTAYSGYGVPDQPGGSPDQVKRHLLCVDRGSGKILWNKEAPGRGAEEATIRENHGYASSTPAVDAERIYTFFGRSGVYAFNHQGEQLWRTDVGERTHGWGSAASPTLFENLVIVNASVESESLVALDKTTGKEVWRQPGMKESWNTPILVTLPDGKQELVVGIFRKILAFDPRTGQPLWSCDTGIDWYMVPSLAAQDGVVYCIGGRSGGCLAVRAGGRGDVTATHRLWTGKNGSNVSSPVVQGDYLYWAKDSPAIAFCAEARTGKILYEERLEGASQIYAAALLGGDHIYYLSRTGRTYVIPVGPKFQLAAANDLRDSGAWNATPAVAGGRLYLRSDKYLYAIGSPQ